MPSQKSPAPQEQKDESLLSFIPPGVTRSVAEYSFSLLPGMLLIIGFFFAAQFSILFIENDLISFVFFPVICVAPVLAGIFSTFALEKVRHKPLSVPRGAIVGAMAGFFGGICASIIILLISFFSKKYMFDIPGIFWLAAACAIITIMQALLAAFGGALIAKFIKE